MTSESDYFDVIDTVDTIQSLPERDEVGLQCRTVRLSRWYVERAASCFAYKKTTTSTHQCIFHTQKDDDFGSQAQDYFAESPEGFIPG